ncbi:MAG: MFS transporter [Burkholderiaceae bacterium]|nr:MAG: MFS transporter [Burkholderiaceae bacterium]
MTHTQNKNSASKVLFASLVGTTIEFFDFYIYATAAVLVFPKLFFPSSDPTAGMLQSLATFALAFFARPVGSALFGHFGDRIGRKATLVAALLTMGLSTVLIGLLPTHASIGLGAPLLLALCRIGQGLGLGGEWGGAVLLATENAPAGKRAKYGMFPQLGAPIGFLLSGGTFLWLSQTLSDAEFFSYGWRIPFLASALLVLVGLYVRLNISETPEFEKVLARHERVKVPVLTVFAEHGRTLFLGMLVALAAFVLFYLMTVFTLSWGTTALGYTRPQFLKLQLVAVVLFGLTIPVSAWLADRYGRRPTMLVFAAAIVLFGLFFAPLFRADSQVEVTVFLSIGMGLIGLIYAPLGTLLSELFPAQIRYTGASLAFNLSGILGASLAPYVATWLATHYGLEAVGYYLSLVSALTFIALLLIKDSRA